MLGAMILTGGGSSRMGEDKAGLDWGGVSAVARLSALAREVGAAHLCTVGAGDHGLPAVTDEPAAGGPVGGVLAGSAALRGQGCVRTLVLAVDAPTLRPEDLLALLAQPGPGAAYAGLHFPAVVDLAAVSAAASADWPMARLWERAGLVRLPCPDAARLRLRGANTPQERTALLAELRP